jgi:VCBS repeat-containing protein
MHAAYISLGLFLASTPPLEECLTELVAQAEEQAGNSDLAEAVRSGATTLDGASNAAPVAVADAYEVDEGGTLTIAAASGVLANDTDPDANDTLSIASFDATSEHGAAITRNVDGTLRYDPTVSATLAEEDVTSDTFSYTLTDGHSGVAVTGTVYVTLSGSGTTYLTLAGNSIGVAGSAS